MSSGLENETCMLFLVCAETVVYCVLFGCCRHFAGVAMDSTVAD